MQLTKIFLPPSSQIPDRLENDIDLYLRPPVNQYGTLQFSEYGAIVEAGFKHAETAIKSWKRLMRTSPNSKLDSLLHSNVHGRLSASNNADLASNAPKKMRRVVSVDNHLTERADSHLRERERERERERKSVEHKMLKQKSSI